MTQRGKNQLEKLREEAVCPWCDYSLRGLPGDFVACPECGKGVDVVLLLLNKWDGPGYRVPTYGRVTNPAWWFEILLLIGYWFVANGIQHSMLIGLTILVCSTAIWGWLLIRLKHQFKSGSALKVSMLAHLLVACFFIGLFSIFFSLVLFFTSTGNPQVSIAIILFVTGIVLLTVCHKIDRHIVSQCVRLYLMEQARLISSNHEH